MKKIFAIISVLVLSFLAAAGNYNYSPTEVMEFSISDDSFKKQSTQSSKQVSSQASKKQVNLTNKSLASTGSIT